MFETMTKQNKQVDIYLNDMKINKLRLANRTKYLIVNLENFKTIDELLDKIAYELENGTDIVQINEILNNAQKTIIIGKKLRELCSIYNVLLIMKSRIDIAQIIEADGIFLEKNDISIHNAKELVNETMIFGTKSDTENEINDTITNNFDYVITKENTNIASISHFYLDNINIF